jgi:hypothetical protein
MVSLDCLSFLRQGNKKTEIKGAGQNGKDNSEDREASV